MTKQTYTCMIEGAYGRASRLTKQFNALTREQARSKADEWCRTMGEEFDVIELSVVIKQHAIRQEIQIAV